MHKLQIQGGARLHGEVTISGAKNAALPILTAALLTAQPVHLSNVPGLNDVTSMLKLLEQLGLRATHTDAHAVTLQASHISNLEASYDIVKTMRASILVLGPLLARFGRARVSLPGGCAIGSRPVDQHIKGLQAMGAQIEISHGYINATAPGGTLRGARIRTDMITVTGTENLLMAATLAQGTTVLENAAREPEVVDLAHLLVKMGAQIEGIGTDHLVVHGVDQLHGAQHAVIADRIEAGTFLCAVAAAGGDITLRNAHPESMGPTLDKLAQAGLQLEMGSDWIRAQAHQRMQAVNVRTQEHPGFPTDMQAQLMTVNCVAQGTSLITETIFENRFMHVNELMRLGADITIEGNTAMVKGVTQLSGATVMATDLRASACLVIAGLVAEGTTVVDRIYHLDRGYERMEEKLSALGARIQRVQ